MFVSNAYIRVGFILNVIALYVYVGKVLFLYARMRTFFVLFQPVDMNRVRRISLYFAYHMYLKCERVIVFLHIKRTGLYGPVIGKKTYTVTWSLKDTGNTTWSDNSTGNKSANWSINWVNGQSHYSNDIYNRGWLASGWKILNRNNKNFILYDDHMQFEEEKTYDGTIILTSPNDTTPLKRFLAEVSCVGKCSLSISSLVQYRNYREITSISIGTFGTSNQLQTLYSDDVGSQSVSTITHTYTDVSFSNTSGTHKVVKIYRIAWVN